MAVAPAIPLLSVQVFFLQIFLSNVYLICPPGVPNQKGTTEENIAEDIHFHCLRRPDSLRK